MAGFRRVNIYYGLAARRRPKVIIVWFGTFVTLLLLMWLVNSWARALQPVEYEPDEFHYLKGD